MAEARIRVAAVDEQGRTFGFGIDIGGSGIKGARVDLATGELASERIKFLTPKKPTPANVVPILAEIVQQAGWTGPFGCTFPGVVRHGVLYSAANLGDVWLGVNLEQLVGEATGLPTAVLNDADAAGLAEVRYGAAKGREGVVILTTLGTGIGTAVINDGALVPNTEFGHLQMYGRSAEKYAASSAKERKKLSYSKWAERLQEYYSYLEFLTSPDVIIVGGGISRKSEKFLPLISTQAELIPAELRNQAGIVGAAVVAHERFGSDRTT
jgi:polyphosphate glucokinase